MIEQVEHIKKFALQDNSALTVKQFGEAIARMCDDAIREAVEQPLAPDGETHLCGGKYYTDKVLGEVCCRCQAPRR